MTNSLRFALVLLLAFTTGCATDSGFSLPGSLGGGVTRTLNFPVARVKPAFVTTVVQMGMTISAVEMRGKGEVIKARGSDRSVEIEVERLGANSTRVRVSGSNLTRIMSETEKRLNAAAG
jgi:hypothetical protein